MSSRWSFALALCVSVFIFSHADAKHHKNKNKDGGAQLEQCTIVKSGGMGCVAPQKLVCQKLKNGQKCCGCVGDKPAPRPMDYYECHAAVLPQSVAGRSISSPEPDESTARTKFLAALAEEKLTLNGPVTCKNLGPGK
jgi:hypothetical protein